jgi:FkbM family methyltransferase
MLGTLKKVGRTTRRLGSELALPLLERPGNPESFAGAVFCYIGKCRSRPVSPVYFDAYRFRQAKPSKYDAYGVIQSLSWMKKNSKLMDTAAALLEDDYSRELLKQLLAFRVLGPLFVSLPNARDILNMYDRARQFKIGPSKLIFPPFEVDTYAATLEDQRLELECWLGNVAGSFLLRQYYFNRDSIRISPQRGDAVIDAGACLGDSALAFATSVGNSGEVHSFEPIPAQAAVFEKNRSRNEHVADRIHLHPFALSDKDGERLTFTDGGAGAHPSAEGPVEVRTTTIDEMVKKGQIRRVDFLKMDIEGAEFSALNGASETIRRFGPRLAISIYHSTEDLFRIAIFIKRVLPSYKLYIDHYTAHSEETVLYAVS